MPTPDCNPQKPGEGEGDWPELVLWRTVGRPGPIHAARDLVKKPLESRRYVPATSNHSHQSPLLRVAEELERRAREARAQHRQEPPVNKKYTLIGVEGTCREVAQHLRKLAAYEQDSSPGCDCDPDGRIANDCEAKGCRAARGTAQRLREEAEGLGEEGASAITAFRAGFQYGAEEPTRDPNEAYETFLEFTHEARSQDREDQAASSAIPPDPQEGEGR